MMKVHEEDKEKTKDVDDDNEQGPEIPNQPPESKRKRDNTEGSQLKKRRNVRSGWIIQQKQQERTFMIVKQQTSQQIELEERDKTFTTGFTPNISHSGKDKTETLKHILNQLVILVGCDLQEFVNLMDYWMSDRSGDGDVVLENLQIDEECIVKCNAHTIFAQMIT